MPTFRSRFRRAAALALACTCSILTVNAQFPDRPPADVTSTMDRDQMMQQLGISFPQNLPSRLEDPNRPKNAWPTNPDNPDANWTDAKSNTITRGGFGLWVTYDDDNPGDYTPIDLLRMKDGTRITTAEDWWNRRRPEIRKDVEELVWGVMPDASVLPSVRWEVTQTNGGDDDVPYVEKRIVGHIDTSRYPEVRDIPRIDVTLRVPARATRLVPVIVNFGGQVNPIWDYVKAEGWGAAAFNPVVLQPDNGAGLTSYLIGLVSQGNWRKPSDWGSLVAWSWGISRLIDYFDTDPHVDATRVGLAGHSRYGKATMTAMAYEPRLAVSFPSCGGTLGPAMFRRHWGQNLENISWDREHHWMAGNAFRFMGPLEPGAYMPRKVELLPVDAHSLLALAAPRPVFLNGGTTDTWSDAPGTYLAGVGATPVYELLGRKGVIMNDGEWPKPDVAYLDGDIGYRVHEGGHTPAPDWPAFVEFARRYLN